MGNRLSQSTSLIEFENWTLLPPELKSECIKHMDFKSRVLLRSTSRTEKSLIDAQQFYLHHVRLEGLLPYPVNSIISSSFDTYKLIITPSADGHQGIYEINARNHVRFAETMLPLLLFILRKATIDEFSIERINRFSWIDVLGEQITPESLNIKSFHGVVLSNQETLYFISKLNNATKSIHFDANGCRNFPFDTLIENKTILNSKNLQIRDLVSEHAVWKLTEKWIENDAEIGKVFRLTSMHNQTINQFSLKFKDRVIFQTEEEVRIRTDNPSKHILLKLAKNWKVARPLTCIVISSEFDESEFETFEKWVTRKMISLWEYFHFIFSADFEIDEILNFYNTIMLLLKCFCQFLSLSFKQNFIRH